MKMSKCVRGRERERERDRDGEGKGRDWKRVRERVCV